MLAVTIPDLFATMFAHPFAARVTHVATPARRRRGVLLPLVLQPDCGLRHPLPVGFGVELEVELVPADDNPGALIKHRRLAEPPDLLDFLDGDVVVPVLDHPGGDPL
jgi:hypothetical protein